MPKVIATAEVEDITKWEAGFATHVDLFRQQTIASTIHYNTNAETNRVTICFEPEDVGRYLEVLEGPETAEAMAFDGVKRETVEIVVLDDSLEV